MHAHLGSADMEDINVPRSSCCHDVQAAVVPERCWLMELLRGQAVEVAQLVPACHDHQPAAVSQQLSLQNCTEHCTQCCTASVVCFQDSGHVQAASQWQTRFEATALQALSSAISAVIKAGLCMSKAAPLRPNMMMRGPSVDTSRNLPHGDTARYVAVKETWSSPRAFMFTRPSSCTCQHTLPEPCSTN